MEVEHLWPIFFLSLHAMVPITLAAIGETIEESAGLFNIGLEGMLLISALTGALGAEYTGSAIGGLLVGLSTGALLGLVFGVINILIGKAINSLPALASIYWRLDLSPSCWSI